MATYTELYDLGSDSALRNKFTVACLIAAQAIMVELDTVPLHANRIIWARSVFSDPNAAGQKMLMAGLAANAALTVVQIRTATDAALLTTVQAAINLFATGV